MDTRSSFVIDAVQASLFLDSDTTIASSKIVAIILQGFGDMFDGEMQVLPIPADAPPELPRVLIQSGDGNLQFNAGPARVDLIVLRPASIAEGAKKAVNVLATYCEKSRSVVNRVAIVIHRSCDHQSPPDALISRFCSSSAQVGPFARSTTFEIHNHKEYTPSGLDYAVNSWVRCRCGKRTNDSQAVILVEQDINSLSGDNQKFSVARMSQFFEATPAAADEIFQRYFPETNE